MHLELLLFDLADRRFALPSDCVREVMLAMELTPLPRAPWVIEGLANVRGEVIPVLDLRARFRLPTRPMDVNDHFIIVQALGRKMALHVDRAVRLHQAPANDLRDLNTTPHVLGAVILPDGMTFINDVESFLSATEAEELDALMAQGV